MDAVLCCFEKYEYAVKQVSPLIKKKKIKSKPTPPKPSKNAKGMGILNPKLLFV